MKKLVMSLVYGCCSGAAIGFATNGDWWLSFLACYAFYVAYLFSNECDKCNMHSHE